MLGVAMGDLRSDAPGPQVQAMGVRIVRSITVENLGATTGSPTLPSNRRNGVHQRDQLGDIVAVGAGQADSEGNAVRVRKDVMLRAFFTPIRRIGPGFVAPPTARRDALSTAARDQSILSASWSRSRSNRCSLSHTPRRCQACSRRQQVMPDPQPSSCGRYSQGIPVRSTKRIPLRAARCGTGFRPGNRNRRRFGGGNSGSITLHSSSSKIGLAIGGPPCPTLVSAKCVVHQYSFC